MKIFFFIIIVFLFSCSSKNEKKILTENFDFSKELSFNEFKYKLEEYAKTAPYPNIDY